MTREENPGEGQEKLGRTGEEEFYLLSNGSTCRMEMSIKGERSMYDQV
jgi:hypothetical protein